MPNYTSLTFLDIPEQQNVAKKFISDSKYNLTESNLDSHISKSTEWSAVAYLTNSIYGICNGAKSGCRSVYKNNSTMYNTGASSGTNKENSNLGTYSYLGQELDEYGLPTEKINNNILSSTTGNVYGVYDMVGGAYETVMITNNKNDVYAKELDAKYYQISDNKPILGDIFHETSIEDLIDETAWQTKGGNSSDENISIFSTNSYDGKASPDVTFRVIIL